MPRGAVALGAIMNAYRLQAPGLFRHFPFQATRIRLTSRWGGAPNRRLYSRLNWDALS